MARIRTIKPEFWMNEELAETSEAARLLAIGLLNHSDDEGYFKAHASLIKAAVFPLTDPSVTIHECLTELSNANYIRLFRGTDGKQYGKVINFESHQVVNRPKASKISPLDSGTDESVINHGKISDQSSQEGKGKEQGKEETYVPPKGGTDDYSPEFEQAWKDKPKREGGNSKKAAYKQWRARIRAGATAKELTDGMLRYRKFCESKKIIGTDKVKMMATFWGPDEHYLEDYATSQSNGYDPMSRDTQDDEKNMEFQRELIRMTRQ